METESSNPLESGEGWQVVNNKKRGVSESYAQQEVVIDCSFKSFALSHKSGGVLFE